MVRDAGCARLHLVNPFCASFHAIAKIYAQRKPSVGPLYLSSGSLLLMSGRGYFGQFKRVVSIEARLENIGR